MFIPESELPLPDEYRFLRVEDAVQALPADIAQRTVVLLDCGNIDRNPAGVLRDGAHLLNIDHHHDNTRFGTLDHVVPGASCTAEIVWDMMNDLGVAPTPEVADGVVRRARDRHGALHVREHRPAGARDGGRADRGGRRRADASTATSTRTPPTPSSRCSPSRSARCAASTTAS